MKTTIELPDSLMREAKAYAAEQGLPLREVFEQGLEEVLRRGTRSKKPYKMRVVTTKGEGLQVHGGWEEIRSMIYEGHGG